MDIHTPTTLLRTQQVCEYLGVCRQTLYQMRKRGEFPAPVKVGAQLRWRVSDLEAWTEAQAGG